MGMTGLMEVLLPAGRSAIELALFVLLPVMVAMLSLMRLLEARGVLDMLVALLSPLLRPFGLTGLGVFAALQINLVSFAAPIATMAMMEQRGVSDRHLAATLAMVLAMAQANVVFPMVAMGLDFLPVLLLSLAGGLCAAATTYHVFGRRLSAAEHGVDEHLQHPAADSAKGVLDVLNRAGAEALRITLNAIPLLVLSLVAVAGLRAVGAVDALVRLMSPLLRGVSVEPSLVLPSFTKYVAGGTAMMGLVGEMLTRGQLTRQVVNASAGFLIHPMDLPGVAVLMTAGARVAATWRPAVAGACIGILLRTVCHALLA
jgi:spore maturation protein SpmB